MKIHATAATLRIPLQGRKRRVYSGGKEPHCTLLRPLKPGSKRARFVEYFRARGWCAQVPDVMIDLIMSRQNVIAFCACLRRDHGIGYQVNGDTLQLIYPVKRNGT